MKPRTVLLNAMLPALVLFNLAACEQGPAERAGERIDRGVDRAGDSIERAGDRARDNLDRR